MFKRMHWFRLQGIARSNWWEHPDLVSDALQKASTIFTHPINDSINKSIPHNFLIITTWCLIQLLRIFTFIPHIPLLVECEMWNEHRNVERLSSFTVKYEPTNKKAVPYAGDSVHPFKKDASHLPHLLQNKSAHDSPLMLDKTSGSRIVRQCQGDNDLLRPCENCE